jgi:putative tryptophan/tyrosine transport system substrate-binding protein
MRRRVFLSLITAAALSTPVFGQTPGKVYRLGVLSQVSRSWQATRSIVLPELARSGFIEGTNLIVDFRTGEVEGLPRLAREMVNQSPDAILAIAPAAARAARQTTNTIPIVLYGGQDAIAEGLAMSLSRPGGNVTGVVILTTQLDTKRLQMLHQAIPAARRIALLQHSPSTIRTRAETEQEVRSLATNLGIEVFVLQAAGPEEYPAAFASMKASGAQALVIGANASFFANTDKLIALALEARLPTICEWAEMAKEGCLIGYGPDREKLYRVAAGKLAHILQGVPPASIPIEQPTFFALALNLRTARALGVDLPPDLTAIADQVFD